MPIECRCPGCGGRFRAADEAVGRRVACPKCQTVIQLPGASKPAAAPTSPSPPKQTQPPQKATTGEVAWFVRTADDNQHGPMAKGQLDQLVAQGRLDAFCEVRRADWDTWRDIEEIYPSLAMNDSEEKSLDAELIEPSADSQRSRVRPCPDCGQTVSRRAVQCPHCGCPLIEAVAAQSTVRAQVVHTRTNVQSRDSSGRFVSHDADDEDPSIRARRRRRRRIIFLVTTISLLIAFIASGVYVAVQIHNRVVAAKNLIMPAPPTPPSAPSTSPSTQANKPLTVEQIAKCKEEVAAAMARNVDEHLRATHDALAALPPQIAEYAKALEMAQEMADPLSNRRDQKKKDDSKTSPGAKEPYQSQYEELHKECLSYLDKHVAEPVKNPEAIWNVGRDWYRMRLPEQKILEELLQPGTTPNESR